MKLYLRLVRFIASGILQRVVNVVNDSAWSGLLSRELREWRERVSTFASFAAELSGGIAKLDAMQLFRVFFAATITGQLNTCVASSQSMRRICN
jgi:hypothetical protein